MNYKIIFLIISILLTSCKQINIQKIDYKSKFSFYSNKGFALVYNDDFLKKKIVSNKIDQRSLVIFSDKLLPDTPVRITNLINGKYLIARVGVNNKFPMFYNSVISKRIASDLEIDSNEPYVEIKTLKFGETRLKPLFRL